MFLDLGPWQFSLYSVSVFISFGNNKSEIKFKKNLGDSE